MTTILTRTGSDWTSAATLDQLVAGVGMAVQLRGGEQAALFLLPDGRLCGVGNVDPFGRAAISHGRFEMRASEPVVLSPLGGRAFSLLDGRCLAEPSVRLPVHAVQVQAGGGVVQVRRAWGWPAH